MTTRTEVLYYDGDWQRLGSDEGALHAIEVTYGAEGRITQRRPLKIKKFQTFSTDPRAKAVMLGQDEH